MMLNKLRTLFTSYNLNGYVIPAWDEFQNEYVGDNKNRLKFLTGFTGSNGILFALDDKALFFTDGRYLEQASKTLNSKLYTIFDIYQLRGFAWDKYLERGCKIGYDPMLFTSKHLEFLPNETFIKINDNLVDKIWQERPVSYLSNIQIYLSQFAGEEVNTKLNKIQQSLNANQALLMSDTSSVCWLLNLRDFGYSTIGMFDAYLILEQKRGFLFTDIILTDEVINYLQNFYINVLTISQLKPTLNKLSQLKIDKSTCPVGLLDQAVAYSEDDSYKLSQSLKNDNQIQAAKIAHLQDAIALCEFFAWLEQQESVYEDDLASVIIEFRTKSKLYIKESFYAICGFKANAAIIHYRAIKHQSMLIEKQGLLLIDTGGHYFGGTTDVTRVVCRGQHPSDEQKLAYTLVLKGHINLANAKFKVGLCGKHLDVLARQYLWQYAMDYPHSTGHGVGNFLNVHEGPQAISLNNNLALRPGMIVSNEPGYYKVGEFGIRLENLMYVKSWQEGFLQFEPLTLLPFEPKLINFDMLEKQEMLWLSSYYANIASLIRPKLTKLAQKWLDEQLCVIKF